ncbi:MAG: hypothetical protein SFU25_05600, partial [Candidatus Caenarcaniphilales bacterium]|nr:hypothetical protein [Candidatus Caenarcaniphilales bacterium]
MFLMLWTFPKAFADITYNPLYLVIYAPNGNGFGAMTITNPTDAPVRMQTEILEFELSDEDQVKILNRSADEKKITDYVKVSPKQFTLEPQQKKIIRIATKIPSDFKEGVEYKLLLSMIEIGADRKQVTVQGTKNGEASYGLIINKAINAGTYVRIGSEDKFKSILEYDGFKVSTDKENIKLGFTYHNKGNKHARRNIGLRFIKDGHTVFEMANAAGFIAFSDEKTPRAYNVSIPFPKDKIDPNENYSLNLIIKDDSLEA